MTITEALRTIESAPADAQPYRVIVACGFTPLHLNTFLAAHLQRRLPDRKVAVSSGLYGDLLGTVRKSRGMEANAIAIALEWTDLDPRLGYRSLGGWGPTEQIDVVRQADASLAAFRRAIEDLAEVTPAVVSFPMLPLPPAFYTGSWQAGSAQVSLSAAVYQTAVAISAHPEIPRRAQRGSRRRPPK